MGLAAGQARLLSITSRKSDCEFQSMRLSHQKIALARELADLSNEYQNSLDQTKLIYDYYGTGDTNTPLTYGILMTPSALNDYMPVTLTDSSGRVTLNSKYAAAARRAGIPQEGLGTLPSETMRNEFINGLADAGLITNATANTMLGIPYNQGAGFGGDTTTALITESGNIDDLCEYLNEMGAVIDITIDGSMVSGNRADMCLWSSDKTKEISADANSESKTSTFNLGDLLNGDVTVDLYMYNRKGKNPNATMATAAQTLVEDILNQTGEYLAQVLDLGDGYTQAALEYAMSEIKNLYVPKKEDGSYYTDFHDNKSGQFNQTNQANAPEYIGWINDDYKRTSTGHNHNKNRVSISNMLKAYLTYFADYLNGVDAVDANGNDKYKVQKGKLSTNSLVTDDKLYTFTWAVGSTVSSDDLSQSVFYDTLFNQICANGWTENNNIEDKEYLQQMLQSGMLYISKIKDDGYYYQTNYATDSYIKEIADDTYIAQAEAKYNTQKAKLNAKEETLDLKMKNLDTEISSLTTEYDTVKNTISKNIEKSFKRYNA